MSGRTRRHRQTHYLIALGRAAVEAGYRVRYFTAIELVEWLYRFLADNTVAPAIETVCRNDLIIIDEIGFAPLDHTGCQHLFRLIAAAYERRSVAIASHSPFEKWGRFLPTNHRRLPPRPALPPRPSSPPAATATGSPTEPPGGGDT